jgi:hypothetical protein
MVPRTAARRAASYSEITRTSIGTLRPRRARRSRTDSRTQSSTDGSITRRSTSEPGRYPWREREPKSTIFEHAGTSSARRRRISSIRTSSPTGRQYRSTELRPSAGGPVRTLAAPGGCRKGLLTHRRPDRRYRLWRARAVGAQGKSSDVTGSHQEQRRRQHESRGCITPIAITPAAWLLSGDSDRALGRRRDRIGTRGSSPNQKPAQRQ